MNFETLPGFRTFYPEDCFLRNYIFNTWRSSAQAFNFSEYDTALTSPFFVCLMQLSFVSTLFETSKES